MKTCLSVSQRLVFFKIPKILSTLKMILFKVNYVYCHFCMWCDQGYCSVRDDWGGVKSEECPISGESQRHGGGPWSSYCLCLLISFLSNWLIKLSIVNKHLQARSALSVYIPTTLKQFSNSSDHSRATFIMLKRFKLVPLISFLYSYSISNHKKIG